MTQQHNIRHILRTRAENRRGLLLLIPALLAICLLMLGTMFLAVGCGGDDLTGPEAAVQKFLTASENKDVDAVFELMHPQAVAEMQEMITAGGETFEEVKPMLATYFFPYDSVKFSDIEFQTTELSEEEVIVQVVGGTMTQTIDGVTETYDADDSDPLYLYLVDGEWYIDFDAL